MSDKVLQQLASEIASLRREVNRLKLMEVPAVTIWTDWAPTVTQSGSVTVTVNYARYMIIQNTAIIQVSLEATAGGSAGNPVIIGGQPDVIAVANLGGTFSVIGSGFVENGATRYAGQLVAAGANDWRFIVSGNTGTMGATPSFALASGDEISFIAMYERAG